MSTELPAIVATAVSAWLCCWRLLAFRRKRIAEMGGLLILRTQRRRRYVALLIPLGFLFLISYIVQTTQNGPGGYLGYEEVAWDILSTVLLFFAMFVGCGCYRHIFEIRENGVAFGFPNGLLRYFPWTDVRYAQRSFSKKNKLFLQCRLGG
jgi:hypothetical protein